ncbi:hypothetical protein DWB85_01215 [Seongchinamella sediminis]|uniref:Uncharacterized protein n=1 Tax=Seongchinamella sediminis TaxID=2283635 RepID=A0A3L7E574_9GAMM|nr:hypothetical protein [Seongchinamella sediminis]RLQ23801.1 hypothetical protein DWB85_01215 [Seongchinamella sediminis]
MTIQRNQFNARELCSRKLWQIVNSEAQASTSRDQLQQALQELATRRHYLAELSRLGKLHNA